MELVARFCWFFFEAPSQNLDLGPSQTSSKRGAGARHTHLCLLRWWSLQGVEPALDVAVAMPRNARFEPLKDVRHWEKQNQPVWVFDLNQWNKRSSMIAEAVFLTWKSDLQPQNTKKVLFINVFSARNLTMQHWMVYRLVIQQSHWKWPLTLSFLIKNGDFPEGNDCLVGGLEHLLFFPYIGNNFPNWLSYFSEGWLNHQPAVNDEL